MNRNGKNDEKPEDKRQTTLPVEVTMSVASVDMSTLKTVVRKFNETVSVPSHMVERLLKTRIEQGTDEAVKKVANDIWSAAAKIKPAEKIIPPEYHCFMMSGETLDVGSENFDMLGSRASVLW